MISLTVTLEAVFFVSVLTCSVNCWDKVSLDCVSVSLSQLETTKVPCKVLSPLETTKWDATAAAGAAVEAKICKYENEYLLMMNWTKSVTSEWTFWQLN